MPIARPSFKRFGRGGSPMDSSSRRQFLRGATIATAIAALDPLRCFPQAANSPFRVAVINDEISPDFDHVCSVVSKEFGLNWIELRSMWGKNVMDLSDAEIAEAKRILAKNSLQVTDIASPLFKTDWPGAPRSAYGSKGDMHGAVEVAFRHQDEVLERSISLAKQFSTGKVRCFDFWRLDDVAPYREAIDEKLRSAAEIAGKQDILLVLENEFECNTATGREAARTLNAIQTPQLGSGQRCHARRTRRLPWRMGRAAQESHSPLSCKKRGKKRKRQNRMGARRYRIYRLDGPVSRPSSNRIPRCSESRNPLARSRNTGRIYAHQLGRNEEGSPGFGHSVTLRGSES